jgi:hypothetical protein
MNRSTWSSASSGVSRSAVSNTSRRASADRATYCALNIPLPPLEPVDTRVVVLPSRTKTSLASKSVSSAVRFSRLANSTRAPSSEMSIGSASTPLLPPAGPNETRSTTPPLAVKTSAPLSVSSAVQRPVPQNTIRLASADAATNPGWNFGPGPANRVSSRVTSPLRS